MKDVGARKDICTAAEMLSLRWSQAEHGARWSQVELSLRWSMMIEKTGNSGLRKKVEICEMLFISILVELGK